MSNNDKFPGYHIDQALDLLTKRFKLIEESNFPMSLQVRALEAKHNQTKDLLGTIIATFRLTKNRTDITQTDTGVKLYEIVDNWIKQYEALQLGN